MFRFRMSSYDSPSLAAETEQLLRQRLEQESRRVMPWFWRLTDRLNAKRKKPRIPGPPASCRREAARLLAARRAVDYAATPVEVTFDGDNITLTADGAGEMVPLKSVTALCETEHLWLVVCGKERGLLLQKRDLQGGAPEEFSCYLRAGIERNAAPNRQPFART